MENLDFIKVAAKVSGNGVRNADNWKKAFLIYFNGNIYLLSHVQAIADDSIPEGLAMHGMKFATLLGHHDESRFATLENYATGDCGAVLKSGNVYIISATTDPEIVAAVHAPSVQSRDNGNVTAEDVTTTAADESAAVTINSAEVIAEQLTPLFGAFGATVAPQIAAAVDSYIKSLIAKVENNAKANAANQTKVTANNCSFDVTLPDGRRASCQGIAHNKLTEVLNCIFAGLHPYLYGPSGTGKTELCKQVAEILGLPFYSIQTTLDKTDLIGYLSIQKDELIKTDFYKAVTEGGVFLADEADTFAPEVSTCYNSLLSNGFITFPGVGRVAAHKDFIFIAAGNTIGRGATTEFSARCVIDGATLSRFAFINCDYDRNISILCAGADGVELVDFVDAFRAAAKRAGIDITAGTREIKSIASLHRYSTDMPNILNICLLKGLATELVDNIIAQMPSELDGNKWLKALKKANK